MPQRSVLGILIFLLAMAVMFSGCTSPQSAAATPPATQPATPVTVITTIPPTAVVTTPVAAITEKTPEVTKTATRAEVETLLLTTKGMISPTEFKTYDFKAMGDQFSKIGVKYRITLKSDKPVFGYAVTATQASELQGNTMIPVEDSSADKIQWGLITPYMSLGKVTDETKTFTVETIAPYVYVVDARWMESDENYVKTPPFNYELTITKITSP
ncbi:MAG: hypothetical protein WCH85_04760 [Methanomicrobiales archaeon]